MSAYVQKEDEVIRLVEKDPEAHSALVRQIFTLEDANSDGVITWDEFRSSKYDDPYEIKPSTDKGSTMIV